MKLRFVSGLLALGLASSSCGTQRMMKKLIDESPHEFDHYYALRPYLSDDQKKTFLKLKTEEERNDYLKGLDLWDRFYDYSEFEREMILAGDVAIGWKKDMVVMAWGAPYDKQKAPGRQAVRSERYVYRFEGHPDGVVYLWSDSSKTEHKANRLFRKELVFDDDILAEITEKAGWE